MAAPLTTYTGINVRNLPYLKGLSAHINAHDSPFTVDILVGADHYWVIVENEVIKGPCPTAAKSKTGYLLSSPLSNSDHSENPNSSILNVVTEHQQEQFDLEGFWRIESVGAQHNSSEEAPDFLKYYQDSSIMLKEDHYSAKLPWRPQHPLYHQMQKSLSREPAPWCHPWSENWLQILRNYVPHHAVLKDSTTTPLRIVYDCSFNKVNNPA